ncbi:putative RNA-splicing ligase RtcB [Paratrimastix pyriformis]|uniref:3'-phosphate/5'-hydroxy nucleic acid ligase n=1 Tax=Paratrimastix pyriformis TaxID=342808 RepID=A0ABQ8UPW2_9EUKA|nr:putative RNA-splicing ligase RtcB [Paratrimastix pyriformis]
MPDAHPGNGTVVGYTQHQSNDYAIPAVIGGDIGCGVLAIRVGQLPRLSFAKLDKTIRRTIATDRNAEPPTTEELGIALSMIAGSCAGVTEGANSRIASAAASVAAATPGSPPPPAHTPPPPGYTGAIDPSADPPALVNHFLQLITDVAERCRRHHDGPPASPASGPSASAREEKPAAPPRAAGGEKELTRKQAKRAAKQQKQKQKQRRRDDDEEDDGEPKAPAEAEAPEGRSDDGRDGRDGDAEGEREEDAEEDPEEEEAGGRPQHHGRKGRRGGSGGQVRLGPAVGDDDDDDLERLAARLAQSDLLDTQRAPLRGPEEGEGRRIRDGVFRSLGTLGGGNHFIEVDEDPRTPGCYWVVIHSGSRNFGQMVYMHWQARTVPPPPLPTPAVPGPPLPPGAGTHLARPHGVLEGSQRRAYLEDVFAAQLFAQVNRRVMAIRILGALGFDMTLGGPQAQPEGNQPEGVPRASPPPPSPGPCRVGARLVLSESRAPLCVVESVHNYIDPLDHVVRKGAIAAHEGCPVVVPLNMRDGTLLGVGRGNPTWNWSAPHGAGRMMTRAEARRACTVKEMQAELDRAGVYSTCVCRATLDESPLAYKDANTIEMAVAPCMAVVARLRSVYNFKAADPEQGDDGVGSAGPGLEEEDMPHRVRGGKRLPRTRTTNPEDDDE